MVSPFTVRLTFHGDLGFFLKRGTGTIIERQLAEKTAVKDVIESCGIPHPEIDLILVGNQPVGFEYLLEREADVSVYPISQDRFIGFTENRLQTLQIKQFIADCHLGKLVRNLRLLGLDVDYDPEGEDRQLLEAATIGHRALLTRNRRLLMHAVVHHGYYLRSQDPLHQTMEVLRRFDLFTSLAPFTRCLRCNEPLEPVEKAKIIDRLDPLTKIYYEQFRRCSGCGQLYWPGSHFKKLEARVSKLRQQT
ncbi:MAG TPA: Mut7-C RNAse domain-containing protein [Chthoniobacterales bacterium]|nr:Mut7-C RNAse domain-containing protein [Chthoniobacterales bacterium]